MDNSKNEISFSQKFYSDSFYTNMNEQEKSMKSDDNCINSNESHIILCVDRKEQINDLINNIDYDINKWILAFINNFKIIIEDFNKLKLYIKNSEIFNEDNNISTVKSIFNNNNKYIFIENSINNIENEVKSQKLNKSFCNNKNNNLSINNITNKSIFENKENNEKIKKLYKKLKRFDLSEINSKFTNDIKNKIKNIEELMNIDEDKKMESNLYQPKIDANLENINILIPKANSYFGLDNQFEIIEYNENNLLIHINNNNDLILKLINKENKIIETLIMNHIFEDYIREIRYFSEKYDDKLNEFLLVSSRKNELKIFKILKHCESLEDILKEENHITEIYKNEGSLSKNFFDLSSCAIQFNEEINESKIFITCWEGNSIKIYNLSKDEECKKEIISKTSCNIKYCDIFNNEYLLFCGCNSQDEYTCANCIDLKNLDYSVKKDANVEFKKYRDNSKENRNNVFFNLMIYEYGDDLIKYLIICDEKGYIRIFNFCDLLLINKIFPSNMNKSINYKDNIKRYRLNSIILWKSNYLLITERNTGYLYLIKIIIRNDKIKDLYIEKCFNLFNNEIISIRKYDNGFDEYFLALGKNFKKDTEFESEEKILLFKFD